MARLLLILALVATAFWVYTIVDCAVQPATRHRGVSKPAWMVIVILLPVLGGILWFVIGRGRAGGPVLRRAPDDDPEFLGGLSARARADQDERIRRLEEELAQLDSEGEDPRDSRPAPKPDGDDPGGKPGDDDTRGQRGAVS
ncbi:PLDc N-terminal domain-containing protein [Microbacterium proteolyticum]|uniref:PLD nuclease N-terminal domain-containing protein n=2 Tax=Bacteria TaxID=2 RepID=UPI002415B423|nr:PLDc N-terminal domain-containing protein [Microbacterium proteolyticum]